MKINTDFQEFLEPPAGGQGFLFLSFHPKLGWRLSNEEMSGESENSRGNLIVDPESLSVGYKIFTVDSVGQFVAVVSEFAVGDEPAIKLGDLPALQYKTHDGKVKTDTKGWRRAGRIDGVLARKGDDGKTEYRRVRYETHSAPGCLDLSRLVGEAQKQLESNNDPYPVVSLGIRDYSFTGRDGEVKSRAPNLSVLKWLAEKAYTGALAKSDGESTEPSKPATAPEPAPAPAQMDEVMSMADDMDGLGGVEPLV